ncbi:MAG: hypothetical protein AAF708_19630 [Deinococcota bacterium]
MRLFRSRQLPQLFGDDSFTRQTLRFAWHITSVMGLGFAYLLFAARLHFDMRQAILNTVSIVFAACGCLALGFTRARHLSWLVFLTVAVLAWLSR